MKAWQVGYDEAYRFVKECREIIEPNEGFKAQLIKFEMQAKTFVRRSSMRSQESSDSYELDGTLKKSGSGLLT